MTHAKYNCFYLESLSLFKAAVCLLVHVYPGHVHFSKICICIRYYVYKCCAMIHRRVANPGESFSI